MSEQWLGFWVDCYNCDEGWLYDCIDGFCEDAESGCEDCAYKCSICHGKGGWYSTREEDAS